ncbi:MAG: DUF5666 domain-containing protein [Candidatus Limnocylindrales bacterium]
MRTTSIAITPMRLLLSAGALLLAVAVGATAATAGGASATSPVAAGGAATALVPTAADLALAANTSTANVTAAPARDRGGLLRRFLGHAERVQITVATAKGDKTILYVRGQITALSSTSVTITMKDKATQSFTIDTATKIREKGKAVQPSGLATGERAMVLGLQNLDGSYTAKLIRAAVPAAPGPAAPASAVPSN